MWDIVERLSLLVAAIASSVNVYLWHRSRKDPARRAHLQAIKEKVFDPLLEQLKIYYMPILNKEQVGIESATEPIWEGKLATERPISSYREYLRVREPDSSALDANLYECMKENHFPELAKRWEDFQSAVRGYNKACLAYAKELRRSVVDRATLSSCEDLSNYDQKGWANTRDIAIFILRRQLGQSIRLDVTDNGTRLRDSSLSRRLAEGSPEEIQQCIAVINDLLPEHQQAETLGEQADELKATAIDLRKELKKFKLSRKLPGDCPYCEV